MKRLRQSAWLVVMGSLSATAAAHHPIFGKFDPAQNTTVEGIVTYVDWRNPHAHVFINVTTSESIENWAIELPSPIELVASGWSESTLAPGDRVEVQGPRARNGTRQLWADTLKQTATGRTVYTIQDSRPPLPLAARPAPRWPDGQVALGATNASVSGYWSYPSETALVEDGVEVEMSADGLLADIDDAGRVAPMQDWAEAVYRHRQTRFLQDDPTYLNCKPPGGPRQYQSNLGLQLLEDRDGERIFVLLAGGNHNYRIIFLDGRDPIGQVGGDDDNPLYYGRSVAGWDGDTLVVDTRGFNEDFWFTQGGLPHTNQLRLTEKFTRVSADILHYEVEIDDSGAYTRPWTASWNLTWVGGQELPAHFCQNNRP
jgi:hypothetical protein